MTSALHLLQWHRRMIESFARRYLPGVEIWAYGSRVNGQSHDSSDLDLVLRGPDLAEILASQLGAFGEALQESTLPFLVDARDGARFPDHFHVLRHGDTIVGTVRHGNGSFAVVGKEGLTASTGFAVLRPKADYSAQFVWFAVTSRANVERLARLTDGGAYPAVSAQAVADTAVVRAEPDARRKSSNLTAPLVAKRHAVSDECEELVALRDSLLPQLISGRVRIQEAEKIVEAKT